MPWAVLTIVVAGLGWLWYRNQQTSAGPVPQGLYAVPAGEVAATPDTFGGLQVTVLPGFMGTLHAPSGPAHAVMTAMAVAPVLGVGTGSTTADLTLYTKGTIQSVASDNHGVLPDFNTGLSVSAVALGSPLSIGTANLTIRWTDTQGRPQISTMTVVTS